MMTTTTTTTTKKGGMDSSHHCREGPKCDRYGRAIMGERWCRMSSIDLVPGCKSTSEARGLSGARQYIVAEASIGAERSKIPTTTLYFER